MRVKTYKKLLWISLIITCLVLIGMWIVTIYQRIPGNIKIRLGEEQVFRFGLPITGDLSEDTSGDDLEAITVNGMKQSNIPKGSVHIDLNEPVSVKSEAETTYQIHLKLFGIIPFKNVDVDVVKDTYLKPVGQPVGIYLKTEGILVVGTGKFTAVDGNVVSPAEYVLKNGDYIFEVNHTKVNTKSEFVSLVEASEGEPLVMRIKRGGEEFDVEVYPQKNQSGVYKVGVWVRDNAQGIGTMTYVDENGNFGALGHGISDIDVNQNFYLKGGTLYDTEIIAIKKGSRGNPGEMTGVISYTDSHILGTVDKNTECGIFGTCNDKMLSRVEEEALPIALKQEVRKGEAQIFCTINGEPEYFDIEIKEIYNDPKTVNKGIVIEITDSELLAQTGGIVQGMSGAPIIQDGRFVGAVTHVLVNEPRRGYGILAENMLEAAK